MAPVAGMEPERDGLTGGDITSVISYRSVSQKTYWHDASICRGEIPTVALNCLIFVTALNYYARQSMVAYASCTTLPKTT